MTAYICDTPRPRQYALTSTLKNKWLTIFRPGLCIKKSGTTQEINPPGDAFTEISQGFYIIACCFCFRPDTAINQNTGTMDTKLTTLSATATKSAYQPADTLLRSHYSLCSHGLVMETEIDAIEFSQGNLSKCQLLPNEIPNDTSHMSQSSMTISPSPVVS